MFSFFQQFSKQERKIKTQVKVFLKWRRKKKMSLADYEEYLNLFLDFTAKDDVLDVTALDLMAFLDYLSQEEPSTHRVRRAEVAVRQFKRFYAARGAIIKDIADYNEKLDMEGVHYLADVKRNREIFNTWEKDQENPVGKRQWSYRKLASKHNISFGRVYQIIKREKELRYASKAGGFVRA